MVSTKNEIILKEKIPYLTSSKKTLNGLFDRVEDALVSWI